MRRKTVCALSIMLLVLLSPVVAKAAGAGADAPAGADDMFPEPRSIYVGDVLTLDIAAGDLTTAELRAAFGDFEILEIKESQGGRILSLRTFEPGEYTIQLGNREIVIDVRSTLDDIQREELFEGEARTSSPGLAFHWRIMFYVAAGVFALFGGLLLFGVVRRRAAKTPSPLQVFLDRANALSVEDDDFLVRLTLYFKEYLGSLYGRKIIGRTSREIMDELRGIDRLTPVLGDIENWLTECDRYKFTGVLVEDLEKNAHRELLLGVSTDIDGITEEIS